MKTINFFKKWSWLLVAVVSVIAFNNCGEGFIAEQLSSSSLSGGLALYSRAPGETCEDALLSVYKNTYHPFLVQNCNACHITGGVGNGVFAVEDPAASYASFASKGSALINSQSVGLHKPPYTGPKNSGRINEISSYWATAQTGYASCLAETGTGGGGGSGGSAILTTGRAVAANLGNNFVRMEWDLETQSAAKLPLVAGIEIRRASLNNAVIGYEFRNPTLRLKNATAGAYAMRAMNVYVNNQLQSELTTYSNIEAIITSTTDFNYAAGFANGVTVRTPAASDTIALEFQSLKVTTAPTPTPTATPTPTPVPTVTPTPAAVTFTALSTAGGVFAKSCNGCHSGGSASGGLDMTNYAAAKLAAQNIKARMNNANNPMPKSGLLGQADRDRVSAWVDAGAPQ